MVVSVNRLLSVIELKIPPVVLVLIFAVIMGLVSGILPELVLPLPWSGAMAGILVSGGVFFSVAGVWAFRRARTTVNPVLPGTASFVVATGVYRLSRNPMYLGFLLVLAGWGVFLSHAAPFLLLPVFVAYMNRFQIVPEERALSAKFGDEYVGYMRAVRRWL